MSARAALQPYQERYGSAVVVESLVVKAGTVSQPASVQLSAVDSAAMISDLGWAPILVYDTAIDFERLKGAVQKLAVVMPALAGR